MPRRSTLVAVGKGIALFGLIAFAGYAAASDDLQARVGQAAHSLASGHDSLGAMALFVGIYAIAVALGVPGFILTMVGGAAFGLWKGFALNMGAALIGCAIAHYEARFLGRELAQRLLGQRLARLESDVCRSWWCAFRTLVRLRLMPILPFAAVNLSVGLTRIPMSAYLSATAVGIVPSTFLFTLFSRSLLAAGTSERHSAVIWVAIALAGLFVLSFLPAIVRWIRRATREELPDIDSAGASTLP